MCPSFLPLPDRASDGADGADDAGHKQNFASAFASMEKQVDVEIKSFWKPLKTTDMTGYRGLCASSIPIPFPENERKS